MEQLDIIEWVVNKVPMNSYKLYEVSGVYSEIDLNADRLNEATSIGTVSAVSEYGAIAKLRKLIAMDVLHSEDTLDQAYQLVVEGPFQADFEDGHWDVIAYALPLKGEEAEAVHVSEYRLIRD